MQRRTFLATGALAAGLAERLAEPAAAQPPRPAGVFRAVSSVNATYPGDRLAAVARAMERMRTGADTLDAAIAAVNIAEDDPRDDSVGLGGLPNEDGVVELDSSVMHGPTAKGGAVASLRSIRNPSLVAKRVMERTDHCLLVGEGALRFARAHGFREENLLTDASREVWLRWRETLNDRDNWIPPANPRTVARSMPGDPDWTRPTGTVHVSCLNDRGDLSGCTSTSGLAFKIPGRVGDSPIFGAGLYVDNEVGAAGSTGRGEANLLSCASFLIVEQMRAGRTPTDACTEALRRIARKTEPRLRRPDGQPKFQLTFYALKKDGTFGGACMHAGAQFAVHDGTRARFVDATPLFPTRP